MAGANLWIGSIPITLDEASFEQMFARYGTILSTKLVSHRRHGFVKFANSWEADAAIAALNGTTVHGSLIIVKYAGDASKGSAGGSAVGKGAGASHISYNSASWNSTSPVQQTAPSAAAAINNNSWSSAEPGTNLYVKGLPANTSEQMIVETFSHYGTVSSVKVLQSKGVSDTAGGMTVAFVRMSTPEEADWLVENLDGNIPQGMTDPVSCQHAQNRKGAKGGKKGGLSFSSSSSALALGKGTPPVGQTSTAPSANGAWSGNDVSHSTWNSKGAGQQVAPPGLIPDSTEEQTPNLYVKGLPANLSEIAISELFTNYGSVNSVRVLESNGISSMTVALIRMATVEEAEWLVQNLDGNIPEGLQDPVSCQFARGGSKGGKGGKGSDTSYSPYGKGAPAAAKGQSKGWDSSAQALIPGLKELIFTDEAQCRLYVKGLPLTCDDLYLYRVFAPFGAVQSVKAMVKGTYAVGFVKYATEADASNAIEKVHMLPLTDGITLQVSWKTEKAAGKWFTEGAVNPVASIGDVANDSEEFAGLNIEGSSDLDAVWSQNPEKAIDAWV